jgi:hypothetical protein
MKVKNITYQKRKKKKINSMAAQRLSSGVLKKKSFCSTTVRSVFKVLIISFPPKTPHKSRGDLLPCNSIPNPTKIPFPAKKKIYHSTSHNLCQPYKAKDGIP